MATRKSFILHKDSLAVLDALSNEQAGMLFKAIAAYQNGEDLEMDQLTSIAFAPFKSQFERDDEKYQNTCKARALAGSKGGKQKVANASKSKQKVANLADSDSKNKSDSKKEDQETGAKPKVSPIPFSQVIDVYHEVLHEMPTIQVLTDARKAAIRSFWTKRSRENGGFTIENWRAYCGFIAQHCRWMMEDRPNGKGGFWNRKNLDYILKDDCYCKVKEDRANDQ